MAYGGDVPATMYSPRMQSQREINIVTDTLQEFNQMILWRNTFAQQWEETAELIFPEHRNTFYYQNFNWPGEKKTHRQIDASGMVALHRFAAICDSLLTPRNVIWQQVEADDDYVMQDRATRLWFEQVTKILFKYRYHQLANFASQNHSNFLSLGAFGNHAMFIDEFDGAMYGNFKGLRYMSIPLGELYFKMNHQHMVDGFIRWFKLTARQAEQKWPGMMPPRLISAMLSKSEMTYNFLHRVCPRTDYDPNRLDAQGKPWASYYISVEGQCLLQEGGYNTFPMAVGRYIHLPVDGPYGRGPAQLVLPALKTLNAQKRTFLKQGHRAADPVLLTADDGIMGVDLRPGALNKGGVDAQGRELVKALVTGNIQTNEKMMDMERSLINDMFLVSLFQILVDTPQMSATEVLERANEKGILIAPTVGRQDSEYIGPMTHRELDLLSRQRLLPPMPPRLREAKGSYKLTSTSPLARLAQAQQSAGFLRTLETVKEIVQITGDTQYLDPFNFNRAVPAIAAQQAVPESWMSTDEEIKSTRDARAKAQAAEQKIKAAPAAAAMIKARAVAAKAGQGQTPQPGQQPGQPPGQPGQPAGLGTQTEGVG